MVNHVKQVYLQRLSQVEAQYQARVEHAKSLRFSNIYQEKLQQNKLGAFGADGMPGTNAPDAPSTSSQMPVTTDVLASSLGSNPSDSAASSNTDLASMMAMAMASGMGGMGMDGSASSGTSGMLPQMMSMMMINQLTQAFKQNDVSQDNTGKPAQAYNDLIEQTSARHQVPAPLIKAVIQAESGYRADAVSPNGAQGLMQLMPGTASELGVTDVFDPAQNIDAGVRYLKQHLDTFDGDVRLALAAYNTGSARIKALGIQSSSDTQQYTQLSSGVRQYVNTVLGHMANYSIT